MATTHIREAVEARPPDLNPHVAEILAALASQARLLCRPALLWATVSCTAAAIVWLSSYGSYIFDSPKSFLVCTVILGMLLLPGIFLLWVYGSLLETAKLSRRLRLPSEKVPAAGVLDETDPHASLLSRWGRRLERLVDGPLRVWSSLEYSSEMDSLGGGAGYFLRFLAKPASQVVVAVALLASGFLVLLALLHLLSAAIGAAF